MRLGCVRRGIVARFGEACHADRLYSCANSHSLANSKPVIHPNSLLVTAGEITWSDETGPGYGLAGCAEVADSASWKTCWARSKSDGSQSGPPLDLSGNLWIGLDPGVIDLMWVFSS